MCINMIAFALDSFLTYTFILRCQYIRSNIHFVQALPSTYHYTRLALQQVIGERSILESCRCAWDEFETCVRCNIGFTDGEDREEEETETVDEEQDDDGD
jgi:hypothetical protein